MKTKQWQDAFRNYNVNSVANNGGPSFSEGNYDRQCPAFAKVASGTTNIGTSSWLRGDAIIENENVSYDISYKYHGKMIAYFGVNPPRGNRYIDQRGSPNHVGFFLNFVYDNPSNPRKIVGFWMLDQNWEGGIGTANSPANWVIRKHLVMVNGKGRYGAKNYYIVD